jgi:transposase
MPYANVAVEEIRPPPGGRRGRPLVLHAPSDDSIKGSPLIEAALRELGKHYDFEYVAVRGKPHREAMQLYADADLVIDQVLAGWYGGFAVELMSMAKPVVCYLREEDLGFLPPAMRGELPLLTVDPRRLTQDLARIFDRRAEWADAGEAGRRFVLRWHNPRRIAAAMIAAYRDPQSRFVLEEHV